MDYGALTAARLRSGQWLHWGIRFFLAAALTASETVDCYAPFALGCIAAAGPGAGGAAALGGGVTRSLSVNMHGKGLRSYLLNIDI